MLQKKMLQYIQIAFVFCEIRSETNNSIRMRENYSQINSIIKSQSSFHFTPTISRILLFSCIHFILVTSSI